MFCVSEHSIKLLWSTGKCRICPRDHCQDQGYVQVQSKGERCGPVVLLQFDVVEFVPDSNTEKMLCGLTPVCVNCVI